VAGADAIERVPVPPGVQADEVERHGGEDVFEVDLRQAPVARPADTGDRDGLADGALNSGRSLYLSCQSSLA
jgi:hypothetical protein